jgi:hypothetical protein
MEIVEEDRWKFLDFFNGKVDTFNYEEGAVMFSPHTAGYPQFGGKNWKSAVDNGIRKYRKLNLF